MFDDNGSTSSGVDLFELAPTKGAFASDLASDTRDLEYQAAANEENVGSSPIPPAEIYFGAPGGINGILNVAPIPVAMSSASGAYGSANPFTTLVPLDGIHTVVPPETYAVPVTKTPVDSNPDAGSPINFVTTPDDASAAVLVNGDGEIVSALSNSTAGGHSGTGGSSSGGSGSTSSGTTSSSPFVINVIWDASVNNAPAAFKADVIAAVSFSRVSSPTTSP